MPKKKKQKPEFEPFPEELDRAVESDLILPLEKQLPLKWQKELDKDFVVPLKRRHMLGIAIIIIAAALFSFAIIGFDVVTPGTMNPFVPQEPEAPAVQCAEIPPINLIALTGGAEECDVSVFDADGHYVDAGWNIQGSSLVITEACLQDDYTIRIVCAGDVRYEDGLLDAIADMADGKIELTELEEQEPEKPPATVFPDCTYGYGNVEITASEITDIGACFRDREEYNTCIVWGIENGQKQELPSYELTLSYYSAAQRCAISLDDRKLSAEIDSFLGIYTSCWRLPADSNYPMMAACFRDFEERIGNTWSNSTELMMMLPKYEALAQGEIDAYNQRMSGQ